MGSSSSRGCSKHTDAAASSLPTHSTQPPNLDTVTPSQHSLGPGRPLQPTVPWRKLSHFGRGAGRLLRPLLGALRPAQPQRVAPLTYWPLPAMEAGGWYGPCCSILQSKAIHATIDPPTPSWVETCGSGSRPAKRGGSGGKSATMVRRSGALCQQMEQLIRGY